MKSFPFVGAVFWACAWSLGGVSLGQATNSWGGTGWPAEAAGIPAVSSSAPYGPSYVTPYPAAPSVHHPYPATYTRMASDVPLQDPRSVLAPRGGALGQPPAYGQPSGSLVQVYATPPSTLTNSATERVHVHGGQPLPTQTTDWLDVGKCSGCVKCGQHACQCLWFGSVGVLGMTRDDGDHYLFSYDTANEADQRTNTRDAAMDWSYGVDVRFGRYFNCGQNALEFVYWGLYPDSDSTQTTSLDVLGNLNGILNWDSLDYNGVGADTIVNTGPGASAVHVLSRDWEFHNLELNCWKFCGPCGVSMCDCSRLRHNWLAGVRYLRFSENLLFAADANDFAITREDDELFYDIDVDNNLLGFQVGSEAQYLLSQRCALNFGIKLGIFNNHIEHLSQIGGNLGLATINNGPFDGTPFYVASSKNDVAFLGEVNLGAEYCFHRNWTAIVGYRAMAVTGVALPAEQIYPDLRGINDVAIIDSNSSLILHGAYAGIEYNW